jgi:hypothetical protein
MKGFNWISALCLLLLCVDSTIAYPQRQSVKKYPETPTVHLGYEIHQGTINVRLPSKINFFAAEG